MSYPEHGDVFRPSGAKKVAQKWSKPSPGACSKSVCPLQILKKLGVENRRQAAQLYEQAEE